MREDDFAQMRQRMVREQLMGRDIKDANVLDAFGKVPRQRFVEHKFYKNAYSDFPLPIENGQTISQPYIVALMAQLLDIKKSDRVLEIGIGSGYQTAILAELAYQVFSVERFGNLTEKAMAVLEDMGYENINLKTGDGTMGWKDFAPFDKIVVAASAEKIPEPLIEQLKSPGRIVMPVGSSSSQTLLLLEKTARGEIIEKNICGCTFVPLIGRYGTKEDNAGKVI
jgi:protein-L-isoaspartate(D-aspartate) O-methyltransferase